MDMFNDAPEDKSRSQKKRESTAAQKLGAALTALPPSALAGMNLPTELTLAVEDWKKFPGHEAKRRQMQYIGRLMREMDIAELEEKLAAAQEPDRAAIKSFHHLEALRDALLNVNGKERENLLEELQQKEPALPLARLRHLCETAQAERENKRPPKAYRELFRILKKAVRPD